MVSPLLFSAVIESIMVVGLRVALTISDRDQPTHQKVASWLLWLFVLFVFAGLFWLQYDAVPYLPPYDTPPTVGEAFRFIYHA